MKLRIVQGKNENSTIGADDSICRNCRGIILCISTEK